MGLNLDMVQIQLNFTHFGGRRVVRIPLDWNPKASKPFKGLIEVKGLKGLEGIVELKNIAF